MKSISGLALSISILVSLFVALAVPAALLHAQEITKESVGAGDYGDFVVGPGKVELPLAPGESRVVEMTVTNRLGGPRLFSLEIEDAAGSQDPRKPIVLLGDDHGPYTLKDYIDLPENSFVLGAGERARIPVTITIPADSEPGGRYGSVLVTTTSLPNDNPISSEARPSSAIVSRIGTLFFITTPGEVDLDGELREFATIPDKMFFTSGPMQFSILFENSGTMHLNPFATVAINNMLGEEVGFVEVEPWYSMPQSLRLRDVKWDRDFMIGRYTATLELNRGYNDVLDEATVSFWVLPLNIVIPAFGGLLLLLFVVRFLITRFEFKRKL